MRADDHHETARVRAAWKRCRDRAEDSGQADRESLAARLVVHRGAPVVEAACSGHAAEPVAERADPARDLPRPVDVARAVQDVDPHLPGRRQGRTLPARRRRVAAVARAGEGDRGGEPGDRRGERGEHDQTADAPPSLLGWREAGELSRFGGSDSERRGVDDRGREGVVARPEAVEPALLEPGDLLRSEAGAAGGFFDGQTAPQPRRRDG